MSSGLWVLVAILFAGLVLRMPIGFSMLAAGIGYLITKGQDVGLVAEQVGNGLYNSYVLLAVPFYTKPTQAEIIRHFNAVTEATDMDVVLYSHPGKDGVEIGYEALDALAD